jgi:diguanylate cyclase (GGDEF)-like protein
MGWNEVRVMDLLTRLPLGVVAAGADGRVVQANRVALEMLLWQDTARAPAILAQWRMADARGDDLRRRALERMASWQGEARWRTGSGRALLVWESAWRLPTSAGVYDVHVLEDLAVMKRLRRVTALAFYDSLTGLPNRNLLADRVSTAMERSRRSGRPFAVLYLDLDGMKAVNDRMGHAAGDRLLRAAAHAVRRAVRRRDTVARLAGDEFVVVAEDIGGRADASRLALRVLEACRSIAASASIGVSFFPEHGRSMRALLAQADAALYRAKARGRDCHLFAEEPTVVYRLEGAES